MALQPAFWGLAWRKRDTHTHTYTHTGLCVIRTTADAAAEHISLFFSCGLTPLNLKGSDAHTPQWSIDPFPGCRASHALDCECVWLGCTNQRRVTPPTHPPAPSCSSSISLTHTVLYFLLRQCIQSNSWLSSSEFGGYLSLFCIEDFTWSHHGCS